MFLFKIFFDFFYNILCHLFGYIVIMINHLDIFTPDHFTFMFSSFKMFFHVLFIHNTSTLTHDIIIWFKIICH
jgi:hypothetical protein